MIQIRKGTYGSYERPCIYITDTTNGTQEYIELQNINDYGREMMQEIFSRLEYYISHKHEIEVEGFREKYVKPKQVDEYTCPFCGDKSDICNFPDLFYSDANGTDSWNEQVKLLEELQTKGYNIVTCGDCGQPFIVKTR